MRLQLLSRLAASVMALAITACGSSSDDSGPGRITVRLMDGPSVDYEKIYLDVREVQIHADGGWLTLGTPNQVVDLLSLRDGVTATLVSERPIEAGHYTQMRLVLGPDSRIVLAGEGPRDTWPPEADRTEPLVVPSGQQSGVKLNVNFDVQPDTTADVVLDVDAARSVFVHRTGASNKYMLRPVVSAVDVLLTGAIRGVLSDALTGAPLPGADVTAQLLENGVPAIVRSAKTAADGSYLLAFLPAGRAYHVVSQPVVAAPLPAPIVAYEARASGPILIERGTPTGVWDASFTAALAGAVSGAIDPSLADTDVDEVALAQLLDAGGVSATFIVQTTDGVRTDATESYAFPTVPAGGAYTSWVTRRFLANTGDETRQAGTVSAPFDVLAGATTSVNLAAP